MKASNAQTHHFTSKDKLIARKLPMLRPPCLRGDSALFQAIQQNFLSLVVPPRKKFILDPSKVFITIERVLEIVYS